VAKDLRSYLRQLRSRPGDLVEVERPVRPHQFEVTALLKQLEDQGRYPALLFNHPTDQYDRPSDFRLLTNLYASRARCAMMFGVDPATPNYELSCEFGRRARETIAPKILSAGAPVQECVWRGDEADVGRLPIVRHFQMDMGPTLTMTHVMRSLDGIYDISFAKTFYTWDPRRMVVSIHTRDLHRIVREYEAKGEPAPIINVLGHHPAFHHGSLARNPWETDDYAMIGSFLGEPLRLVPSVTWGDRFLVPADAEMIIEGEIPPGERDICDPFGEVPRLYQAQCVRPVFNVKAVTFRRNAIVQDIFSGFQDCYPLNSVATEGALETALRPRFPNLHALHMAESGSGLMAVHIALRDIQPGQADEIGRMVLARSPVLHCAVIVDADIDVFNEREVLWAVHTYANLQSGITVLPDVPAVDHGQPWSGFGPSNWGGKIVIAANRPTDFAFGLRSEVPPDVIAQTRLADYLPADALIGMR
jgi:2,5-furandicarboxylate decarboxylase 1